MMSHVDDRFDHMHSIFDGQFSDLHKRFTVVDTQLDGVHTHFNDIRSHIQSTVHDPIMSRMNNMQQSFQDNMGALSSQFETLSTSDSVHPLDERQQQLQNDFSQFSFLQHVSSSSTWCAVMSPLWKLMPKGEREVMIQGRACCIFMILMLHLCLMLLSYYVALNFVYIVVFKALSV
jgi:ABC-type phosphate transport system auxiliary subunit